MAPRHLTDRQARILAAIEAGHRTRRAIQAHAGISSTSVVAANLERLASAGLIVLEQTTQGEQIYDGRDYCQAWDSACRAAGNPEA